ncbi:Lipooligosaccharide biosynthesis protein lex-1, partial [Haemophilus influenzae]
SISYIY